MDYLSDAEIQSLTREEKIEYLKNMKAEEDKDLVDKISSAMELYKRQRYSKENEWKEADKMRHRQRIGGFYKGQTKATSDEVYKACCFLTGRLRDILFGGDWFLPLPTPGIDAESALIKKDYVKAQLDIAGIYQKAYEWIESIVTFGKGWLKITWGINRKRHQTKIWQRKPKYSPAGVFQSASYSQKTITIPDDILDNIKLTFVPIENLYLDSQIPHLEDQTMIIEILEVPWNHLKAMGDRGFYEIKEEYKEWTKGADQEETLKTYIQTKENVQETEKKSNLYELWQAHFYKDINKDGYDELCVATLLVSKEKIIIQQPTEEYLHGRFPYIPGDFEKSSYLLYPEGVPKICRDKHIALCDNTSRMEDNATSFMNNMWLMARGSGKVPARLTQEQNKVIEVDNINDLKDLRPKPLLTESLALHRLYSSEVKETSRALATAQGLPTRQGTTATEVSQMLGQAGILISDIVDQLQKNSVEPLVEMASDLIDQFITKEDVIRSRGPEAIKFVKFQPWQIQEKIYFYATGKQKLQNQLLLGQQLINLLNISSKLPQGMIKTGNLIKTWMEAWDLPAQKFLDLSQIGDAKKPNDENMLMNQGHRMEVHSEDDDMAHALIHYFGMFNCPEESVELYAEHIRLHKEAGVKEQATMSAISPQGGPLPQMGPSPQQLPFTSRGAVEQVLRRGVPQTRRGLGGVESF